nr:intraflagellar transport protein 20 homolog [Hydra vulgaris]
MPTYSEIFFDEMCKVRLLEPEVNEQTNELKNECQEFVNKIFKFQTIVNDVIKTVDEIAAEVEKEKVRAIGSRNLLKSMTKQRESQHQQLRALIGEKQVQYEQCSLHYNSLLKLEKEQRDFIDQFLLKK